MHAQALAAARRISPIEWIFRVSVAACFIGHGAFGIITKAAWVPYFGLVGIPETAAYTLMPLVGGVDIIMGLIALVSPRRAVLLYMAVWAVWTASLRPLTGESFWELIERAGNYGVPLAFLIAVGIGRSWKSWFAPFRLNLSAPRTVARVAQVLHVTTVLVLVGHGMLALLRSNGIVFRHVAALGLPADAGLAVGMVDLSLALIVAIHPQASVLLAVFGWKVATEALFPIAGAPFWEFVERAGSYGAPILLLMVHRLPAFRLARREAPVADGDLARGLTQMRGRLLVPLAFLMLAGGVTSAEAQQRRNRPEPWPVIETSHDELVQLLQRGGLVMACRHTHTDRSGNNRGGREFNLADRSTQRNLSGRGEDEARALGQAIRELGIPVDQVYTSPYFRTWETATLAFGEADTTRALMGRSTPKRRELFSRPQSRGNRVLMTHIGVLNRELRGYHEGNISEGDCIMLDPRGDEGFAIRGHLKLGDWRGLGS